MSDPAPFALAVLLIGAVGIAAVVSNRITSWLHLPAPALVLVAAAIAVKVIPDLHPPRERTVEQLVTIALVFILYDGGLHIGWRRFRRVAGSVAALGIVGTVLTVAGIALVVQATVGLGWYAAILVATAIAPTDPAMVFSVFGQREIAGRSATILEGESGANDPVGIALMAGLISAGGLSGHAIAHVAGDFALQMSVGLAIGVIGGFALNWVTQRLVLPNDGLYSLRSVAFVLVIFAASVLAHGSGFLAVFVAGIAVGDSRAPFHREVAQFHSAVASLGEVVAFVVLGLTVNLADLVSPDVWIPGLSAAIVLTLVVRPLLCAGCLVGSHLRRGESLFVLFAGLKGAVPILLGSLLLTSQVPHARRLYAIVVVVVVFSVVVQGGLVPVLARKLRVPMRTVPSKPWALGVRLREDPTGAQHLTVVAGSRVDGRTIGELHDLDDLPGDTWVSFIVRAGALLPVTEKTVLQAGDEALVLTAPDGGDQLRAAFGG